MRKRGLSLVFVVLLVLVTVSAAFAQRPREEELGKLLYFDRHLSLNQNQSCASCHDPGAGFADPLDLRMPATFPTSAGSFTDRFGGRNAPPAGYAQFNPPFAFDPAQGLYVGGQFWDGRAATLKDQAKGPFLNPVEMAMPDEAAVIAALKDPANPNAADYLALFSRIYKINLTGIKTNSVNPAVLAAYDKLAQAIGVFEQSAEFAKFSSKYDEVMAGKATFTAAEANGYALFNGVAGCSLCHPEPLFTDFTYDNLGIPKSANPLLAANAIDYGLGARADLVAAALPADLTAAPDGLGGTVNVLSAEAGKFKVSSLRNLALTAPYGHNGYFATIKEIVHFYNTRDNQTAFPGDTPWAAPEVSLNVNAAELGDLGLTAAEEDDLVAFLKTLTDR